MGIFVRGGMLVWVGKELRDPILKGFGGASKGKKGKFDKGGRGKNYFFFLGLPRGFFYLFLFFLNPGP